MDNADILIRALEPEIDMKCSEIKQKKSETLLTKIFLSVAVLLLIIPAMLIFFGINVLTVFVPVIFAGVIILEALPIILGKGAENYGRI